MPTFSSLAFFEAVYTAYEKGSPITYVQIEAKAIDYDARFQHPSSPLENQTSAPTSPSTNVFAQKRSKISSEHSPVHQNQGIAQLSSKKQQVMMLL